MQAKAGTKSRLGKKLLSRSGLHSWASPLKSGAIASMLAEVSVQQQMEKWLPFR